MRPDEQPQHQLLEWVEVMESLAHISVAAMRAWRRWEPHAHAVSEAIVPVLMSQSDPSQRRSRKATLHLSETLARALPVGIKVSRDYLAEVTETMRTAKAPPFVKARV